MDTSAEGLRVIVTAGATGIGRSIALAFAGSGARVFVCDIAALALSALRDEHPDIGTCVADVAVPDSGQNDRRRPERNVLLHAVSGSSYQGSGWRQHHQYAVDRRPTWAPAAQSLLSGKVGRCRVHEESGGGTWAVQY